ncbi:ccmH superfamily protein [Candidatus Endolissoclinum faulkneri L2]|uniref:Cytochrome c-type biogenesis protein n=1 Tax=Candidatus Endolissoclinum faulkneri L2 TaxID=1193729 RepID=K7YGK7_9PROT|nr:cytochrome c-type biogenesis protein [Candidatus Endolissoclinum faulkneri]AFX98730.1 ccmH superfamily protein [Candidatus Endolissoclinum faulkneri L2]
MIPLIILYFLLISTESSFAVEPNEMIDDPILEARARIISANVRCPVCQNQSIDDSHAELAHDLRLLVRERVMAGESDEQVFEFLVNRYGKFILLKPPKIFGTLLLWYGPVGLFILSIIVLIFSFSRRYKSAAPVPLTPEERIRLVKFLGKHKNNRRS